MDWNWLFSSVAQSVAALVGVLGAFLISRMLNSEAALGRNRSRTRELLRESENLADRANARYFNWYNERTLENGLGDVARAIGHDEAVLSADEYYSTYSFSKYVPKATVLAEIESVIKRETERRGRRDYLSLIGSIATPEVRANLTDEREEINQLVIAVKSNIRAVREHLDTVKTNPERSNIVRVALAALLLLFWSGVVYPLTFLPVSLTEPPTLFPVAFFEDLASPRGAMLSMAAVVFTCLILALGVLNERLRHPAGEIRELERWLVPGSYSDFLQVRVDNGFPL
jgi:hypothetical protein